MISDPNLTENASGKHAVAGGSGSSDDLIAAIRAIESDQSLTDQEKAIRRQKLLSGRAGSSDNEDANLKKGRFNGGNDVLNLFDERMNCSFCMQLPERPVTTPCGHNFCLKCFQKWVGQGKRTCANCRRSIPPKMASNPRINSALVVAIRMAKMTRSNASVGQAKVYHFIQNQNRPDSAFTTERAKKAGKANACSGKIFVTVPPDHFGPILAENDPGRNQGILVGETWEDRLECRQWGAHLPHVAGIAGQSEYGSQSVALSGGYEDDEDHGEWFLYTGSGGRDLSGNKRTNKTQSFDQQFEKMNAALKLSCLKGYPVRVVRSHKEKRSAYAPENGVRYDGIYRIEKCWRKKGIQGFRVCRYLFVRCDNDPAPWTSDEHGDRPRPLPVIKELKGATDIIDRKGSPSWDYDADKCSWMWMKPPPQSKKQRNNGNFEAGEKVKMVRRQSKTMSMREKLLKEFSCLLCCKVMVDPLTTPCAHNFCKSCLEAAFNGQTFMKQRTFEGGRTLRAKKTIMKCPSCPNDISDFLQHPQINREMMGVIESLQRVAEEMEDSEKSSEEAADTDEKLDEVDEIDEGTSICDAEMEENSEKSSEEAGDTDAKLIEVAKDANVCNVDSEILDDVKKCILDVSTKTELQKTCDQATDGNDVMNGGAKGTPVKPVASENNELQANVVAPVVKRSYKRKKAGDVDQSSVPVASDNNELQANAVAPVVKRAYKRKKAGDADQSSVPATGVKTRGRKAAELA